MLALATVFTSGFAGVLGQGGGLILFALLSIYIDPPLLIVIHAIIQLFSNASRAAFSIPHVHWKTISPIMLGTLLGAMAVTPLLDHTNWSWMQLILGIYILYITWGGHLSLSFSLPTPMLFTGLLQGSLGMLLGATGPLSNALLLAKGVGKDAIVASNAVIMSTSHIIKVILFSFIGVALWEYIPLLVLLSIAAILGSFIGNKIRGKVPQHIFTPLFKALLSLLALRMVLLNLPFL